MANKTQQFSLPFLRKEKLAKDTYSFFFDRTGIDFDFLPGQYIRMTVPHENADDRGTSRFFTIASSPLEKNHLMITTKLFQSSFKEALHTLSSGTPVQFFGPMGNFVLDETDLTPRVFLAGGVGVTPFHSMIQYAAAKKLHIPITLIVFFGEKEEIIFVEELQELTKKHPHITVVYTISETQKRFTDALIKKHITEFAGKRYYIVGSPTKVAEAKELLVSLQILEEQIVTEDFTGY
jgi:ferredoxin-NADP reductase